MTELLNAFGLQAWAPVLVLALPVALVGLTIRKGGWRARETLAMRARRRIADVTTGLVAIEGRWRSLGLVEDETGAAVLVTRDEHAEPIADGTRVLVVGCAGGEGIDPRGGSYRGQARLPRVVACGVGHFVTTDTELLVRQQRRVKLRLLVGGVLFAVALAAAMAAMLNTFRAAAY